MLRGIIKKVKYFVVTLRISILAIFITFFVASMITVTLITYFRVSSNIETISFDLMKKNSNAVITKIMDEVHDVEIEAYLAKYLLENKIVNYLEPWQIIKYTFGFMQIESQTLPSVEAIAWGNEQGDYIFARKESDGSVRTDIIDRSHFPPTRKDIYHNLHGDFIRSAISNDLSFDPRVRPWYTAAKATKDVSWTDIYPFKTIKGLGITVGAPVYDKAKLAGVLMIDLSLDTFLHFIESIKISDNGVGSSRVDLQACKLEYSIVSPK